MATTTLSAPDRARADVSCAANGRGDGLPDRFAVISLLRAAAPALGLRAPVLATLDAMLSCLPPQRRHHVVFAANATLLARTGGTCDRTLRRHTATLVAAGLIRRQDSANGKRFARRAGDQMAAFGFDLAPLFDRLAEIAGLAAELKARAARIALLRARLRAALQARGDAAARAALPCLRRHLDEAALEQLCATFEAPAALPCDQPGTATASAADPSAVSATDGQNVRHHQKSETEHIDKSPPDLPLHDLLVACPQAAEFAVEDMRRPDAVLRHARMLAPMLGIDAPSYASAETRIGAAATALTIWLIVQCQDRIRSAVAYFRAVTTGARSAGFDPAQVIRRMARGLSADNGGTRA